MVDDDIIAALPLTSADIGRFFAPEGLADKAAWGRRWARKAIEAGTAVRRDDGLIAAPEKPLNAAQRLLAHWVWAVTHPRARAINFVPHKPRGTPERLHNPRHAVKRRLFHV